MTWRSALRPWTDRVCFSWRQMESNREWELKSRFSVLQIEVLWF